MTPEYERADQLIAGLVPPQPRRRGGDRRRPRQVRGYEHLELGRAKIYGAELADRPAAFTS